MSAAFLRLVGAVAGGRTSGRSAGMSSVSVNSAAPLTGPHRGAVSQERQSTAHGTKTERRVR
ncbi:hypothetical protein [Streptomyces rubrogriseus]|uniref:hypothetical protein n=1 Tax=Streptomyces rubrogriseus TaxID=194673 RepID=UPI000D593D82|nr:hypothetical protein [Streptomyces rubrogriseus]